ncbi:hypothetical protein NMG60_11009560 [Bertholletia excelsa]
MVAISLYRGNLHRVPDVPRRWLMPTPKISLKDFRVLLHRRSRALARLSRSTATTIASTSNPEPLPDVKQEQDGDLKEDNHAPESDSQPPAQSFARPEEDGLAKESGGALEEEANDREGPHAGDVPVGQVDDAGVKSEMPPGSAIPVSVNDDSRSEKKQEALENPNAETNEDVNVSNDKEKRKKEVEEKLHILNAKKHNLVQVLKQILNAEEELKRRNSMQGTGRPSIPLQVDTVTNDSGSMTRLATPRMSAEGNLNGDMEGGEAEDVINQHMHSRHLLRTSSTSPSSDSPNRRPFSAVPHPSRASLPVAGSPLRFTPVGHQGPPISLPTLSVSGTSYTASSPSPAASGGTSAFKDSRQPSPWN